MDENNTTKERVLIFIKYKGLSNRKFEILCGLSNGTVNNTDFKKIDVLKKILNAFPELNPEWLQDGTGEMLREVQNEDDNTPTNNELLERYKQENERLAAQNDKLFALIEKLTDNKNV